jgi:hypothetical protein
LEEKEKQKIRLRIRKATLESFMYQCKREKERMNLLPQESTEWSYS